jgi:hypothetical protein
MKDRIYAGKLVLSLIVWATAAISGLAASTVTAPSTSRPINSVCPPSLQPSSDIECGCPPCPPFLILTASPSSLTVTQGHSGKVTITAAAGFIDSSIELSASGVPSGAKVSFDPNPIPYSASRTSKMTITAGDKTPAGKYSVKVTGSASGAGGDATDTVTITLTIKAK